MQNVLKEKLQAYIIEHHPELIAGQRAGGSLNQFLEDKVRSVMPLVLGLLEEEKPGYAIEELSMNSLKQSLGPSRFQYVKALLEKEFPADYERFGRAGVLSFETIGLVERCRDIFEAFGFSEAEKDNRFLRHAIISKVQQYIT